MVQSKPKILVVDDIAANLASMRTLLKKVDAEIFCANSANDGLRLTLEQDFALILLDVQMPSMDGYEMAELLNEEPSTKHIPVIFVTAVHKDQEHRLRGYGTGAVDYIEKPVDNAMLLSKVQVFLDLYNAAASLEQQKKTTESILSAIPDPVIVIANNANKIDYLNEPAHDLAEQLGDSSPAFLTDLLSFDPIIQGRLTALVTQCIETRKPALLSEEQNFTLDQGQEIKTFDVKAIPITPNNQEKNRAVLVLHDVSNARMLSQQLAHQATHDVLTSLPNRRHFDDSFNAALIRAHRNNKCVAIMMIDLDDFKVVNDNFGHLTGDHVLVEAAIRIQACLREMDLLARLGGDEFAILIEDAEDLESVRLPASRINEVLNQPFVIGDTHHRLGASIGITCTGENDMRSSIDLLSDADLAMYKAKQNGRNNFVNFSQEMRNEISAKSKLDSDLFDALNRQEFELHYQPQIDIKNGQLVGMEALIRWQHPARGLVSPAEFIPALESGKLMNPVGNWVIDEACRQIKEWSDIGYFVPRIAVNVSPIQFSRHDFPDFVQSTIDKYDVRAAQLEIEITEQLFMGLSSVIDNNLHRLHDMGFKIALDDFGTGYSSLSYLVRFPIDIIKIDQSFTRGLVASPQSQDLISAIIHMAHGFSSMSVIAEGVEKTSTLALLSEMNCDVYQGYLYSKPLPADQLVQHLKREDLIA